MGLFLGLVFWIVILVFLLFINGIFIYRRKLVVVYVNNLNWIYNVIFVMNCINFVEYIEICKNYDFF